MLAGLHSVAIEDSSRLRTSCLPGSTPDRARHSDISCPRLLTEPPSQELSAGVTAAQHAQERQVQRVENPETVAEVAVADRHSVRDVSVETLRTAIG
jgi:hypothetical protein